MRVARRWCGRSWRHVDKTDNKGRTLRVEEVEAEVAKVEAVKVMVVRVELHTAACRGHEVVVRALTETG